MPNKVSFVITIISPLFLHIALAVLIHIIHLRGRHIYRLRNNVLLWTPTHGRAKAGQAARTYIQQLCEDTGCCPEDLPEAMNDREKWQERVRDIRATSTT